ncbi:MAG: prepilin-type N-terminal cleavage/methylation domain-containing protein [Bacteroidales bacterium]|nr:prepilin-type N-terminal cleavage/methylation domain-containing protein [Bacteroidales bacterium]
MKSKSFTLIELLVVIVIIGILAGVIMISTSSSIDKANFAKAQSFSSTVQNELLSNLVSEWTFDNSSNYGEDTWGNKNGTLHSFDNPATPNSGLMNTSECVFNTCLKFDGVNDYISYGNNFNDLFSNNFSLGFWFKIENSHSDWIEYFIFKGDDATGLYSYFSLGIVGTVHTGNVDKISIRHNNDSVLGISNKTYVDNKWHYILINRNKDNANTKIYIDGALDGNFGQLLFSSLNSSFTMGSSGSPHRFIDAWMDDIRIYNTVLSFSQIKQNYIAGLDSLLSNGNISKEDYNNRINELAYEK